MFQAFSRGIFTQKNGESLKFLRFNTTLQARQRPKEMFDVKLIGTLQQEPLVFKDGNKLITIKTALPNGYFKFHRAIITNPKILQMVGNNLRVGQRVHVSGRLEASNFKNNNDKSRQVFQIRVTQLYASEMNESTNQHFVDVNSVFCLAQIASDIVHFDNGAVFNICTHYTPKSASGGASEGESEKTQYIRIFVYDKNLRQLVKKNLQKDDRIFLNGFLNSKPEIDKGGQKQYGGFIEATNILKVNQFSEAASEYPADENVKSEVE